MPASANVEPRTGHRSGIAAAERLIHALESGWPGRTTSRVISCEITINDLEP